MIVSVLCRSCVEFVLNLRLFHIGGRGPRLMMLGAILIEYGFAVSVKFF